VHEPSGLVSADRQNRDIEWPKTRGNSLKFGVEAGVAGEKHGKVSDAKRPSAPQSGIAIPRKSSRKMLGGSAADLALPTVISSHEVNHQATDFGIHRLACDATVVVDL
jgi:hypothetical protein